MSQNPGRVPGPSVGLTELEVFALTLHHEARSEGRRGMEAVAHVIVNRARDRFRGDSVRAVCLWPWQFSCWLAAGGAANFGALVMNADAIRRGQRVAEMRQAFEVVGAVLEGRSVDETGGADSYYAPAAMKPAGRVPDWAKGVTPTATIARHVFYRLRPTGVAATT